MPVETITKQAPLVWNGVATNVLFVAALDHGGKTWPEIA